MGQRQNYASEKDAQLSPSVVECALSMEHRSHANDAATKDAQSMLTKEECA